MSARGGENNHGAATPQTAHELLAALAQTLFLRGRRRQRHIARARQHSVDGVGVELGRLFLGQEVLKHALPVLVVRIGLVDSSGTGDVSAAKAM